MANAAAFRAKTCHPTLLTSPFAFNAHTTVVHDQDLIMVHTNISVPLVHRPAFHYDNHFVFKQLMEHANKDSGLVGYTASAKILEGNFQTITVWKDTKSLAAFYARGHHGDTMKRWKPYITMGENALTDRYVVKMSDLPSKDADLQEFWRRVRNQEFPEWKRKQMK
jgi:quinol monooxygenase YgiN